MTFPHARVITVVGVLALLSAFAPETRLHAQQEAADVADVRARAEQGDAGAQGNLGSMFGTGEGVPQDYVEAYMWSYLAAAQFSGEDRDRWVKNRDLAASKMTPEQIAEAQRRLREWKPTPEP